MEKIKKKKIRLYLKMACEKLHVDFEDYLAQLEFEIPLCWELPPHIGFMYSDIFLYFLDLDFCLYRKISRDIDKIAKLEFVKFEISIFEKRWIERKKRR